MSTRDDVDRDIVRLNIACRQRDWVLAYLTKYRHLTPMDALQQGGVMRLAARIRDLRDDGHDIRTEMVCERGRRFARYWLE